MKRARYVAGLLGAIGVAIALPVSANAATRTVTMGTSGKNAKKLQNLGSDVNDFFPHTTTIHVGDRVKFSPTGFHTVEFPKKGSDPAPFILPDGNTIAGSNDAAGQPFWFNGQPEVNFNLALAAKPLYGKKVNFNGKKRLETGLLISGKPKPATVRFTRAGTFKYFCNIHPGMVGSIKVLKKRKKIPSAKAHKKKVAAQYKRDLKIAKRLPQTKVPAGVVDVGVAGKHGVEYYGMLPAKVTVPSGTSLQFRITKGSYEAHTATFGPGDINDPNSYIGALAASFEGAQLDQRAVYPSEAPSTTAVLTPSLHGNGFWGSGAMDASAATPLAQNNTVKFGEPTGVYHVPGTYKFYCLIHPFMVGEITVQ